MNDSIPRRGPIKNVTRKALLSFNPPGIGYKPDRGVGEGDDKLRRYEQEVNYS